MHPNFSEVKVEAVWKGQERATWRKPDVQAFYKGLPVAFEIQLSPTSLRVIAERRDFYQREGGLLCWIFKSFDEDRTRLTQDDILYSNNHNLFLASEGTSTESLNTGRLMLDCRWAETYVENGQVATRWSGRIAPFDEFQLDQKRWADEDGVDRIVHQPMRYLISGEWVFSRTMVNLVRGEEDRSLVSAMVDRLRACLMEALSDYGAYLGADSKAIQSHGTGQVNRRSGETSVGDADWVSHKTRGVDARGLSTGHC